MLTRPLLCFILILYIFINKAAAATVEVLPLNHLASVTYFDISNPKGVNSKRFGTVLPVLRHKAGVIPICRFRDPIRQI